MQKYFSLILFVLSSSVVFCQSSVEGLVEAEKNFANTSLVAGRKVAFIRFIDTSGIVFDNGKPVNGFEFYTKAEGKPGILTWEPEYAEISWTNDFGYTTGPWKFYANSINDKPVARGHFITVWHLNSKNEWKFLIDFGITYGEAGKSEHAKEIYLKKAVLREGDPASLEQAEKAFIKEYNKNGIKAYDSFLSPESRLNYAGFLPASVEKERKTLLNSLPANIGYQFLGSGTSPARDLGYVYGYAVINNKQDGYLRIWRNEDNGWKIAAEVLHFR